MTEPAPGPTGRPPDLLFCRGCGGSVARRDFLAGTALLLEGRAWCPACAPGMMTRRRTVRAWLGAGAAALVLLLALAAWSAQRTATEALEQARGAEDRLLRAQSEVPDVARRLAGLENEARGLSAVVEAEGQALAMLKKEAATGREGLEDRLNGVEGSLGILQESLEGLRREVAAGRGPVPLKPEEEKKYLGQLDHLDMGVRFEALWHLQRGSIAAARAAALKGMADPESLVRYQAAILARDRRVKEAVPGLVGLLSDASAAVRAAGRDALKDLEGTDLGFDPLEPSEAKRAEAVHRWKVRLEGR